MIFLYCAFNDDFSLSTVYCVVAELISYVASLICIVDLHVFQGSLFVYLIINDFIKERIHANVQAVDYNNS